MKLLHRFAVCLSLALCLNTTAVFAVEGRLYTSEQLSSTIINDIIQDRQGYLWIATTYGLNRFDGYRFTSYFHQADDTCSLSHNNVLTLFTDSEGQLWVGTVKGLNRYDHTSDSFSRFDIRPDSDDEPRITHIVESPQGSIVVGTSGFGLYEVGKHQRDIHQINHFSADDENDYYWGIFFDRQGRFWKSDNKGFISCFSADKKPRLLLRHQPTTGLTFTFLQEEGGNILAISKQGGLLFNGHSLAYTELHTNLATLNNAVIGHDGLLLLGTTGYGVWRYGLTGLPRELLNVSCRDIDFATASITAVYEDRQHNLWVGCDQRGLLFCPNEQQVFQSWSLANWGIKTSRVVRSATPATDGGLWAALGDGDLYHFDTTGRITRSVACPSRLHFVYRSPQGHYWAAAGSTLYSFDESAGRLQSRKSYEGDFLNTMLDDGRGTLYLSTFSAGMTVVDSHTGKERHYSMYQREDPRGYLCNNWIFAFLLDSKGLLWIATSSGVSCYDPAKDTFNTYGWHNILEGYACLALAETADGDILIGTDRGLFSFDQQKKEVAPFPDSERSLSDKSVNAVCIDHNGDVWCATSMGLWQYSAEREQLTGYQHGNGLHEREYVAGVSLTMTDSRIVFATSEGPVVFSPASINATRSKPGDVVLTAMLVGSQPVSIRSLSDGQQITTEPIERSSHFTLSYLDNTFTMEFSTFDFADARNVALEYKLNDDSWSQTAAGTNAISLNHLRPGTYRLYVQAFSNGQYSAVHAYTITIRAPWYRSTMAYVLYLLAALALMGYAAWRLYRGRQQQMAEEKMQFLINATHDIRTPLTLILSPLHKAMRESERLKEPTILSSLQTIDHNAHRILNLVNQILDIRKIDKQQLQLQCEPTALVPYISQTCKSFEAHAAEHGITFYFEHAEEVEAWIDRIQFDKVIQNLLSNAFKFTADGGRIEVRLLSLMGNAHITVTDTGTGLREEDIPRLFTRFYQSASGRARGKEGTGIGLNLCKMIVEMHHGTITASNRLDGIQGSQFVVTIPLGSEHLKSEELKTTPATAGEEADTAQAVETAASTAPLPARTSNVSTGKRPNILLVDDDAEITDYISQELSDRYRCAIANNGKEALSMLLAGDSCQYDLVVSDIMMPEMDGFTLLRAIKSNLSLQHLPVILLTSESAVGNRLEGLNRGADAFMAKPFIIDELRSQIDNLLRKATQAKHRDTVSEEREKVEQRDVADNDKQLMERIMASINKNLDDSDFSVEQLAADAGLSRSQLHRKMKELTGISPSEFVRNIRMEQAARLLRERHVNVSQVAYSVGFSSLGTFSKVFKQHFGQPPSEYAAQS